MVQIKAIDVKKLREATGAGMMDCKKALSETDGNFDQAVDYLRKKGLSASAKKAGRVASEGMVSALSSGNAGVLIEVNSETDFVSKNEKFQSFVKDLSELINRENPADIDTLRALDFDGEHTVEQALSQLIATIGENMNIRRFKRVQISDGIVSTYVHGAGRIGVLVAIKSSSPESLQTLGRDIAMHVAAANPRYISREDVPADVVERERGVLAERAAASGKPEKIIERIVEGQLGRFYSESCLLEQDFVKDTDRTVAQVLADADGDARIVAIHRFQLGEGIEKAESDFAAEVAAQVHA